MPHSEPECAATALIFFLRRKPIGKIAGAKAIKEPSPGERPVAVSGSPWDPQRGSGITQCQTGENAQLDEASPNFVLRRQRFNGVIKIDQHLVRSIERRFYAIEINPFPFTAAF